MASKNRIDTAALFAGMIGKMENQTKNGQVEEREVTPQPQKKKVGRKPNEQKNIQVSIYLKPEQAKELRLQDAEKQKESDKSAIARTGIDIALALTNEEYAAIKYQAEDRGVSPGEVVREALKKSGFFKP